MGQDIQELPSMVQWFPIQRRVAATAGCRSCLQLQGVSWARRMQEERGYWCQKRIKIQGLVNYLALGYLPVRRGLLVHCSSVNACLQLVNPWLSNLHVNLLIPQIPSYRLHAILGTTEDQRSKEACVLTDRILPNGELEPCTECLKLVGAIRIETCGRTC